MHFGIELPHRDAVLALRDRLSADGIELVEELPRHRRVAALCSGASPTAVCRWHKKVQPTTKAGLIAKEGK